MELLVGKSQIVGIFHCHVWLVEGLPFSLSLADHTPISLYNLLYNLKHPIVCMVPNIWFHPFLHHGFSVAFNMIGGVGQDYDWFSAFLNHHYWAWSITSITSNHFQVLWPLRTRTPLRAPCLFGPMVEVALLRKEIPRLLWFRSWHQW